MYVGMKVAVKGIGQVLYVGVVSHVAAQRVFTNDGLLTECTPVMVIWWHGQPRRQTIDRCQVPAHILIKAPDLDEWMASGWVVVPVDREALEIIREAAVDAAADDDPLWTVNL